MSLRKFHLTELKDLTEYLQSHKDNPISVDMVVDTGEQWLVLRVVEGSESVHTEAAGEMSIGNVAHVALSLFENVVDQNPALGAAMMTRMLEYTASNPLANAVMTGNLMVKLMDGDELEDCGDPDCPVHGNRKPSEILH